jgi:hypothetical protein
VVETGKSSFFKKVKFLKIINVYKTKYVTKEIIEIEGLLYRA